MYGMKMVPGTKIQMIVAKSIERSTEESVMGKTCDDWEAWGIKISGEELQGQAKKDVVRSHANILRAVLSVVL